MLLTFTTAFWMLPRSVDSALQYTCYEFKFLSQPSVGSALAVNWGGSAFRTNPAIRSRWRTILKRVEGIGVSWRLFITFHLEPRRGSQILDHGLVGDCARGVTSGLIILPVLLNIVSVVLESVPSYQPKRITSLVPVGDRLDRFRGNADLCSGLIRQPLD
jgi:hypothetical protein